MTRASAEIRDLLRAAGDVGRDLLAVDWEAGPLGPPEGWPRSLQTVVRAVLTSRFSMWMAWGPELTFFCNDAYRRDTLGTKYPWALGRPASEVWAEIWPDIGPRIERVLDTGTATWDEALLLFLERSGYPEETYHTFSYSPLTDDDGRIAGMLCVVSEDTERVIGDRRLATLRDVASVGTAVAEDEVLAASARRLAGNPQDVPFAVVCLFDEDGGAPRAACATAEHPALSDPQHWPAGGAEAVVELGERFGDLPTGAWPQPPVEALVLPLPHQGQGRPYGFVAVGLNRYRPLDGNYRGFLGLVAGQLAAAIAGARAYESERRRAEALAELDRAKTAFFTNVSHELRTPLTLLLGPAEDALRDPDAPLPGRQHERLEVISRNGQRLLRLVNSLLDFSRLESEQTEPRFTAVDLSRATTELASMFESAVARAGLELAIDCPPLPAPVYVDREMWAKIVLNLLSNALKFTFEGEIRVTLDVHGEMARLRVADTGTGIDPDEQPRLFERFHRVSGARSRSHEGSGIGLALVAELAELHGGRAAVESAPGRGSTFIVEVPLAARPEAAPSDGADVRRQAEGFLAEALRWLDAGGAGRRPGRPPTPRGCWWSTTTPTCATTSAGLLAGDYAVETAPDGEAALRCVRERPPDLVITDVMMPNLDGFGLLAALRADPLTTGVPVIMLSARAGEEGTVEGLEAGADDYLIKPFAARELLARVRANLELDRVRRTRDQLRRSQQLVDRAQALARVGSWEIDLATGAIVGSPELLRQLQVSAAELRERGFEWAVAQRVHADDIERARAAVAEAAERGGLDLELRFHTPDGATRWYHARGELERDAAGVPRRLQGSTQDVTERRAAAAAFAAAAAEREARAREQRIADELQHSLLPAPRFVPDALEVATYYQAGVAGTQVGGDWYDVIDVGADRTALVIGDVMGRGVRAAAVMGQMRTAVRAFAQLDLPPADVLEQLDALVCEFEPVQLVTCIYGVYDPRERTFAYANAGHLPPLVAAPGGSPQRFSGAAGPPLGAGPVNRGEQRIELPPGARVVLYTDGLVERRDRSLDVGIDGLAAAFGRLDGPLGELPAALVGAVAPGGADDDMAVLAAEVAGAPDAATASLSLSADRGAAGRARTFAAAALHEWSLPALLARDVLLLTSELVTNAVKYGRPPVELRLRCDRRQLLIEVEDAATAVPRKLRPSPFQEHGRGLQLVAGVSDRWGTRPTADGKAVWCSLALARYARR